MQISLLTILKQIMTGYNVSVMNVSDIQQTESLSYVKFRSFFFGEDGWNYILDIFSKHVMNDTLFEIEDYFGIQHLMFYLESNQNYYIVGPFRMTSSIAFDMKRIEGFQLSETTIQQIQDYYGMIPVIDEQVVHMSIVPIVASCYSKEKFQVKRITESMPKSIIPKSMLFEEKERTVEESMDRIQYRYTVERDLLNAVQNGNLSKAMNLTSKMQSKEMLERFFGSLRLQKNSLIVYNTLLRKAIELGGVHPYYIDEISARYSRLIELLADDDDYFAFSHKMISEYCEYVHKYSLKNFSSLVKIIIHYININLENDLSLQVIANYVNMNASYISNVFKQEVGVTLTEYIHQRRIRVSKDYLRNTNLSIGAVAERVGIFDVNYYTRLFKKYNDCSPREYRKRYL